MTRSDISSTGSRVLSLEADALKKMANNMSDISSTHLAPTIAKLRQ